MQKKANIKPEENRVFTDIGVLKQIDCEHAHHIGIRSLGQVGPGHSHMVEIDGLCLMLAKAGVKPDHLAKAHETLKKLEAEAAKTEKELSAKLTAEARKKAEAWKETDGAERSADPTTNYGAKMNDEVRANR